MRGDNKFIGRTPSWLGPPWVGSRHDSRRKDKLGAYKKRDLDRRNTRGGVQESRKSYKEAVLVNIEWPQLPKPRVENLSRVGAVISFRKEEVEHRTA